MQYLLSVVFFVFHRQLWMNFVFLFFFLESTMCDRTETRMQIRRNRSPNSPNSRKMTSSVSLCDEPSLSEQLTTNRVYRRTSFPTSSSLSFDYNNTVADDIERRRRRIRSISNSVPPLPVSSIYRGYLPSKSSSVGTTSDEIATPSRLSKLNGIIWKEKFFRSIYPEKSSFINSKQN